MLFSLVREDRRSALRAASAMGPLRPPAKVLLSWETTSLGVLLEMFLGNG